MPVYSVCALLLTIYMYQSDIQRGGSNEPAATLRDNLIRVKPASALPPVPPGQHHLAQQRRGGEALLAVLLEHHLTDVVRGVEADEVEQREGTHGVAAAELHGLVDVLDRADALLVRADGVEDVGHEQPVDDEAGVVAARHWLLAERLGEGVRAVEGLVAGDDGAHHLDQLHQRHWIEK